jgi:alginate O-acetyltransferase complex protein AlgI
VVFSSLAFLLVFLPAVLLLHHAAPRRHRDLVLLCASLVFYAVGEGWYTTVMLGAIVSGWGFAHLVERCPVGRARRLATGAAVAALLAVLVVFKYSNFLVDNLAALGAVLGLPAPHLDPVHLPIGISFFVFQAISYVVDVGRGNVAAEPSVLRFGVYKSFFPQLIAGPIVRWKDVAPQFSTRDPGLDDFAAGLRRFALGLARKVLIADSVAPVADAVFALPPGQLTTGAAWLGAACYGVQIYHDFAGYSDMAIGLARMFGFRFKENFERPYAATSIRGFWRGWHISLSTWFRDYLYIPLGGSRRGPWRTVGNLTMVFLLCGAWHGAAWTFVLWGLFHGTFLAIEHATAERWAPRLPALLGHAYCLVVVLVGWVLFRAVDVPTAGHMLAAMAGAGGESAPWWRICDGHAVLMLVVGVVCALAPLEVWAAALRQRIGDEAWSWHGAVGVLLALVFAVAALVTSASSPFIYFRF